MSKKTLYESPFVRLLMQDLGTGKTDPTEMMEVMDFSYSQVKAIKAGSAEPYAGEYLNWSLHRFSVNDPRYARLAIPETVGFSLTLFGTANGDPDDEVAEASQTLGEYRQAMKDKNAEAMEAAIRHLKEQVIPDMEAESARVARRQAA